MKKFLLIASAATAVAFAATIHAAPSPAGAAGDGHSNLRSGIRSLMSNIANELATLREKAPLSDAQKSEMKGVMMSHKSEIVAQFQKGKDARRAMMDAVEQKGPASAEALKAADAVADSARSLALLTGKIMAEIGPMLTPEQKTLAKAARERIEDAVDQRLSDFAK